MDKKTGPRVLFIIPTDYASLLQKKVDWILKERDENGFLERVITVHPSASQEQVVAITPAHRLYEFHEGFLPFCKKIRLLRYPHHVFHLIRIVWHLLHLMDAERIDFIRATDPAFTGALAWLVARIKHKPFSISIHADYDKCYELDKAGGAPTLLGSRRFMRLIEQFTLTRADRVLPIRPYLARKVAGYGVPMDKVRVIPHGIDLAAYRTPDASSLRGRLSLSEKTFILSFAGRLSRENYVFDILALARSLREQRSDFVILMAGDGPERPALEAAIRRDGLHSVIKLLGFQPREFVISLRKISAVSLCLMGGFSLIEACAAGHPVVSYDVEWHSDLVTTNETGWLVPENDIPALTHAVSYLLDHPEESARMGSVAQARAFDQHDIRKTSALIQNAYLELMSLTSRSAS